MAQRRRNASGGDILAEMYYLSARAALVRWPRRHECWMFSRSYFFYRRAIPIVHIFFSLQLWNAADAALHGFPFFLLLDSDNPDDYYLSNTILPSLSLQEENAIFLETAISFPLLIHR